MKKAIPYLITALLLAWVLASFKPAPDQGGFQLSEFGKLPALLNGRIQPLDSVARNSLLMMGGRQSVHLPKNASGKTEKALPATQWLAEVMMNPEEADKCPVFRIDRAGLELLSLLNLPETVPNPADPSKPPIRKNYFSFNDLEPGLKPFSEQAEKIMERETAEQLDPQQRTPFQKQVMKLYQNLTTYQRLKNGLQPVGSEDFAGELDHYLESLAPGVAAVRQQQAGESYNQQALETLARFVSAFRTMARFGAPLLIPPLDPAKGRDNWENMGTNLLQSAFSGQIHPAARYYARMSSAYRHGQPPAFNEAVREYRSWLAPRFAPESSKARREFLFNHFAPFYKSLVIYVLAFILACASWLNLSRVLNRSAFYLLFLALAIHTGGLIFRMLLEGRPPVTNLYSSAIFIGWGAVILGLILESFYHDGIGSVTASCVGFVTLVIAHNLALGGDTMEMLRAVLDTNFWLATHVVAVTIGYASTFVAGFLALLYVVRGALTRSLAPATARALTRMTYGVVCFATLFSFVGTVLGGIWADQSWGRFWGWDPKENGALLIVIWNAAFLHARWGKLFPERVLMAFPIFGNIVTSFSWFGVNMLGIGLHSYGFMDQAFRWLVAFDVLQVVFIIIACLPQRYWLSFRARQPAVAGEPREPIAPKKPQPANA